MANKTISMDLITQIKLLKGLGYGSKAIARDLGMSKNTVKKYLVDDGQAPEVPPGSRKEPLVGFFPYCQKELKRKGVTRQILWAEYRAKYPEGYSYSQFCELYNHWADKKEATLHIEQEPGDKLYVDFTGSKLPLVDPETGEIKEAEVFVSVLGNSGYTYVRACGSQKKEDFLQGIAHAFDYYGAVPKALVPDNLKSGVDRASRYEAEVNRDLIDLGNHYGVAILPTRSRKPRDKAWVERMVQLVYQRIFAPLRDQVFTSLYELNEAILPLLEMHNNLPLQNRSESRRELFETQEKPLMRPLPQEKYELKDYKDVTVMKTSHVQLSCDIHYYSVPYQYIGQKVKIIYTATYVSIYLHAERIAYHLRDPRPYKYTTVKDHLPSTHQFISDWNPERFIEWATRVHPDVKSYISKVLENKSYPEQTYRSCAGILSFAKKAGKDRLVAACQRAGSFGVYNYKVIEQIINNKLDRMVQGPTNKTLPEHGNIRGAGYYS